MYKNKKVIGIIPARGGSKGLPKKNILPFCGKPLIAYSILQAKNSSYLDDIVVSTDDKAIVSICQSYGLSVPFLRPKQYAKDSSPTSEAVIHALHWLNKENKSYDVVILIEPTSPLRKEKDIDNAIRMLIDHWDQADALVSLGVVHLEHPSLIKVVQKNYIFPFQGILKKSSLRRQNLEKVYFPYGVAYASKVNTYIDKKTFYQERTLPYLIERWQNYEIDDIYDLLVEEAIFSYRDKMKII